MGVFACETVRSGCGVKRAGIIVAVLGSETETGDFCVEDFCFAGLGGDLVRCFFLAVRDSNVPVTATHPRG